MTEGTSEDVKKFKVEAPFNIESKIRVNVVQEDGGFVLTTTGMNKLEKPELVMHVKESMYVSTACRILNDVARYMVERNKCPDTGQRLRIGRWTVVEYRKLSSDCIEVLDAKHDLELD